MILQCPHCSEQHVDEPDVAKGWTNPPHRSHLCQRCGFTWRPADVPTTGVLYLTTVGKRDNYSHIKPEDAQETVMHHPV